MLMLLSPAKRLNESPDLPADLVTTRPHFTAEIKQLSSELAKLPQAELGSLMKLSDKLAELNYQRYQNFESAEQLPALYMFEGDAFQQIELNDYSANERAFAADRLRLLSGLFGVLRPFDLMPPYRLEMSTKYNGDWGKNLYQFWDNKIAERLNEEAAGQPVLNLASNEYADAINRKALAVPLVDVIFKQIKSGEAKSIGIYNKKARGMMVNWLIRNGVDDLERAKQFNEFGYQYQADVSSEDKMVFVTQLD